MGGGAPSIPQRNISQEWPDIKKLYGSQENQYLGFTHRDPLLAQAYPYAQGQLQDVGQLTGPLQDLLGQLPGQFSGYQKQLGGYNDQLGGFQNQLSGLVSSQQGIYNDLLPTLQNQGALTPEQNRDVTQATRAGFASRGNLMGNQALGSELLNRDQYRQQRFGTSLNQALGLSGSIGGLTQEQAGITGQQAGIVGQQAGLTGQQAGLTQGLTSGIQGLQTGALGNVLNTEQTGVHSFSSLTNPILAYAQDLFSSNQNAAAAQSIAGSNKQSGATGGILSTVGSVIGGVAAAY